MNDVNITEINGLERVTISKIGLGIIETLEKLITERIYNNTFALHIHPEITPELGDTIEWITEPGEVVAGKPLEYRIGKMKIREIEISVVSSVLVDNKQVFLIPLPKRNDTITFKYYPDYTINNDTLTE